MPVDKAAKPDRAVLAAGGVILAPTVLHHTLPTRRVELEEGPEGSGTVLTIFAFPALAG